jgi:hypothetical protein
LELPELTPSKNSESSHTGIGIFTNEQFYRTCDKETLLERLGALEAENLLLKQKVWNLKYRGTIPIGIILTIAGGISLALAYVYSSLIPTFIGLGLTFWGAVILYITSSKYIPEVILNSFPVSMVKSIDSIIHGMGCKGRPVFLYPKHLKGLIHGYVFIPFDNSVTIPNVESISMDRVFYDEPRGVLMPAPSQGLVELFEKELNVNFASADFTYVKEILPKLLTDDLKIIDKLSIEDNNNQVHVRIVSQSWAHICSSISRETRIGNHLGCPLCSAIALVISKTKGKLTVIQNNKVIDDMIETNYLVLNT